MRHEPTYEGRPLVRPDEEVVDQGLGFDVTTLLSRRRMLRALGLGAAAASLGACGSGTTGTTAASGTGLVEIPDETAGPYPGDGSNGPNVLAESGIVRSDIRSSFAGASGTADGVPLTIRLTVLDIANGGSAFAGAAVYVWHCNRDGGYSMYSDAIEDQNYLRGVQIADSAGRVSFTSIFPACYSGRWPHIHFEVYPDQAGITDASNAIATSQIALPQDACEVVYAQPGYEQSVRNLSQVTLATDNVFGDDGGARELGAVTGDVTTGYTVSLTAAVDTTTTPTAGSAPGGPPPSR
ncbi:intradiol ring-cleavage dioxygenase [Pseudonocardia cypriaca]|uniref:Protocatechuate 3,4-dioxygenase beta subunit n=1 Tax=Pseudonocardia cypriaca TaxID=882449 RepID=A0A543FX64_9PSEU|nr:intradiol ring-cleavage dioxygenase [Pseudonocardia cypriaca]TQM38430.1 protocatechuate 3,4-dioxygenase beta subunit [Pseudonocardia cypriaca]